MIMPAGLLSIPLDRAQHTLAKSIAFQTWVGVTNENDALPFIHMMQTAEETAAPFCILDLGDELERTRTSVHNGSPFEPSGQIIAYFRHLVPEGTSAHDAVYGFTNILGALWADLEAMAGQPNTIGIYKINLLTPPTRILSDRRNYAGDLFECALGLSWRVDPK